VTTPSADRPVRWEEFVQRVRAHRPTDLLRALAVIAARDFTGALVQPRTSGWNPWAIAAVARESIAYGSEFRSAPVTGRALARIVNAYNDLEDPIITGGEHSGPWDLMLRIAYQQFDISSSAFPELARFAAVFDRAYPTGTYEVLSAAALTDLLGVPVTDYLGATFLFTIGAQRNKGRFDLSWLSQPQFRPIVDVIPVERLIDVFRRTFSASFNSVRSASCDNRNPNKALRVHDFNPLVATPYVGFTATDHIAPLPRLVADKASLSAVYHLGFRQWQERFARDLGALVETYAGEHLNLIPDAHVTPEREYEAGQKSVDWIVVLAEIVVLVEVKSARVNQPSRLNLAAYHQDVDTDVGKAFGQIRRTADLIRTGHHAFGDIPSDRPLRALVVTAEPHYLINSPIYRQGLPDPTVPATVMSLGELESLVAFCLVRDPNRVLLTLTDCTLDHPVNVTTIQNDWYSQYAAPPRNPILDAAWNRMPWRSASDRT